MKYFIRALKYAIRLSALLGLVFVIMRHTGMGAQDGALWATDRGKIFLVALMVWCAIYPAVEYKRRRMAASFVANRDAIVKAFGAGGMSLASESEDAMIFRGAALRRIMWLGEEEVTIKSVDGGVEIEGPRRFVMEAEQRIPYYISAQ